VNQQPWSQLVLSSGNEDQVWELFHENSKLSRYDTGLCGHEVLERVKRLHESLPFEGYPAVPLPLETAPLKLPLADAITTRVSIRDMQPSQLTLKQVGTLLHYAYGVTRENNGDCPRPFRVVPSGGALYPLEIFFHSARIKGLRSGLYHYNPTESRLRMLREGDETQKIAKAMVQTEVALGASLIIFITAFFERSVFKYRDRGYRFVLLEAGHVAQNINLVSSALGLGCLCIGGFFDREIDEFLNIDGVTQSAIYMIAIGRKKRFKCSKPRGKEGRR
jgi:SagB-type dehydrogenase family enzyme